jgi:hypothetical protein
MCGKVSKKKKYAHWELADAAEEPVAVAAAPSDAPPGSPRGGACRACCCSLRGARRRERAAAPPEMSSPPGAGCSNLGELTAGPRCCFPWELAGRAHPAAAPPSRQDLLSRRRKRRWEREGPGKKGSGAHPCVLLMTAERCGSFDCSESNSRSRAISTLRFQ